MKSYGYEEILWYYRSHDTSSAVLSHGTIYLVRSSNFWGCGRNPMVLPFTWNLFSSTFTRFVYYLFTSISQKAISFQIKILLQVIAYSGKPEFRIIRSLFESLWTHAYICQKPVKIVQLINKHFKTSVIYDNLRTTNLNCFARLSKANVNKSGLCTEETVNNKRKMKLKMRKVHNVNTSKFHRRVWWN